MTALTRKLIDQKVYMYNNIFVITEAICMDNSVQFVLSLVVSWLKK